MGVPAAHGARAPTAAGTDAVTPVNTPARSALELGYLTEIGMTLDEALVAATSRAADVIGRPQAGRIAPGARAGLVFGDGEPLKDLEVLLAPQVSEKATHVADKNEQMIFFVVPDATKPEVKAAVELLFKVQVESVQMSNLKGKSKRYGRFMGKRKDLKKAYVCLKPGQEINFA